MDDMMNLKEALEALRVNLEAEREAHRFGQTLWLKTQAKLEDAEAARKRLLEALLKAEGCENLSARCPDCGSTGSQFDACLVYEPVYDSCSVFDGDGPPQVVGFKPHACTNRWHAAMKRLPEILTLAEVK